eukprot:TRINITY_DN2609_c0_g1_i1.p1 TRINITY_DN2609_c0_g1~~TRINITY_DN2609_c0_g1_i1.p1  ORF type:complete len:1412 (+),score=383.91 TRINITY_DN2609_c0_g1_i1:48-4283(+)
MGDELRAALKAARAAVAEKDFKEALKNCRSALKIDSENYNALVLAGVASAGLEQPAQAEQAYRKAIAADPDNPLAWQGLDKLYVQSGDNEKLMEVLEKQLTFIPRDDTTGKKSELFKRFIPIVESVKQRRGAAPPEQQPELFTQLQSLLQKLSTTFPTEVYNFEQLLLLQEELPTENKRLIERAAHLFPDCALAFTALAHYTFARGLAGPELVTQWLSLIGKDAQAVRVEEERSVVWWLVRARLQAAGLYHQHVIASTKRGLTVCAHRERTEGADLNGMKHKLQALQGVALHAEKEYDAARALYVEILSKDQHNVDALLGMANLVYESGDLSESTVLFEKILSLRADQPVALEMRGWIAFQQKDFVTAETYLRRAATLNPNSGSAAHRLARTLWELGGHYRTDKAQAHSMFLKAARLDPGNASNFTYLGHFYDQVEGDEPKALKCFQKAVSLHAREDEAAKRLYHIYVKNKQDTLADILLNDITTYNMRAKWAWSERASRAKERGDDAETVTALQHAVRSDTMDPLLWEDLSSAYQRQGKYTAALKAYERSAELHNYGSAYVLLQQATLENMLGMRRDALRHFRQALHLQHNYLPAMTGLAEAQLATATELMDEGNMFGARDGLLEGVAALLTAWRLRPDTQAVLKLLARTLSALARLSVDAVDSAVALLRSPADFRRNVTEHLEAVRKRQLLLHPETAPITQQHASEDSDTVVYFEAVLVADIASNTALQQFISETLFGDVTVAPSGRIQLLQAAAQVFDRAVRLHASAAALYDLGCARFTLAHELNNVGQSPEGQRASEEAQQCLREAVIAAPDNALMWNGLGVVSLGNPKLQQHAFIRAVELDPTSELAWNNLGMLYLLHNNTALAQKAFMSAQAANPLTPSSWIGLGLLHLSDSKGIVSVVGAEQAHVDALTNAHQAFLHALGIENHPDALLCAMDTGARLKDASVGPLAQQYARLYPSPYALHMLGMFLQRREQFAAAAGAFGQCVALLQRSATDSQKYLQVAVYEQARSLCLAGDYAAALTVLNRAAAGNLELSLLLAAALAGNGQHAQAMALDVSRLATSPADIAKTALVKARISHAAGNAKAARMIVQDALTRCPSSVPLCELSAALALVYDDAQLGAQVAELVATSTVEMSPSLATLVGLVYQRGQQFDQASELLTRALALFPANVSLRDSLVKVQSLTTPALATALPLDAVIARAQNLSSVMDEEAARRRLQTAAHVCGLLGQSLPDAPTRVLLTRGVKFAQRAVHLSPACADAWTSLASAASSLALFTLSTANLSAADGLCWQAVTLLRLQQSGQKHRSLLSAMLSLASTVAVYFSSHVTDREKTLRRAEEFATEAAQVVERAQSADAQAQLSCVRVAQGNLTGAIAAVKAGLEISPRSARLWLVCNLTAPWRDMTDLTI